MKLINQSCEIWGECPTDVDEAVLWIEKAGRVCYRSEDKIVEGSGETFVNNIIKRKHLAVIEHSNFVIRTKDKLRHPMAVLEEFHKGMKGTYLDAVIVHDRVYIGGNYRAWMEADTLLDDLDNFKTYNEKVGEGVLEVVQDQEDIPRELKRISWKLTTDRAVSHELVRHRPASFCQESQRYCRYGDLKFIIPEHFTGATTKEWDTWYVALKASERAYKKLLETQRPEQARCVLPNSTATDIVITTTVPHAEFIFSLRDTSAAYNDTRLALQPVIKYVKENF